MITLNTYDFCCCCCYFQWQHTSHLHAWTSLMMMRMTQVITLLMLKRLHVDPLTMKLVVRKFQKTRVGFYVQKRPLSPPPPLSLPWQYRSLQPHPQICPASHSNFGGLSTECFFLLPVNCSPQVSLSPCSCSSLSVVIISCVCEKLTSS